jgi:carbonic anhydrase/acetyltransferase-like protein (isoleucine patch superfamily)
VALISWGSELIESFQGILPVLGEQVYVASSASVIGDVELGDRSSVWHGAVVRGDVWRIRIGDLSNIQDMCVCHVTTGGPDLSVGRRVTVGHGAILHSCSIEDDCLIGMGAVILDGAKIGEGSIVAAGSIVLEGAEIPPRSLVAGVPAEVKREVGEEMVRSIRERAEEYHQLALSYLGHKEFMPMERK